MSERYHLYQWAEGVAVLDREGEDRAVITLSRALGNPRTRLLALELSDRLNHEAEAT